MSKKPQHEEKVEAKAPVTEPGRAQGVDDGGGLGPADVARMMEMVSRATMKESTTPAAEEQPQQGAPPQLPSKKDDEVAAKVEAQPAAPEPPKARAQPRAKVLESKQFSLKGQVVNLRKGDVIEERVYWPGALKEMMAAGLELELIRE